MKEVLKKQIAAVLATLVLCMTTVYASAYNFSGDGTEESPYLLSTLAHLEELATAVNEGTNFTGEYFKLTADISGVTTIIGTSSENCFSGNFDGNNHAVTLAIEATADNAGMFGYIKEAKISNLIVAGSVQSTETRVGGIAGISVKSTITKCVNRATVSAEKEFVGGILGSAESGSSYITYCRNEAAVSGKSYAVGGIAGRTSLSPITDCENSGEIKGLGEDSYHIGGIVGRTSGKLDKCTNTGSISTVSTYAENDGGVGGVAGFVWEVDDVTNCTNKASIDAEDMYCVGGLFGSVFTSIVDETNNVESTVTINGKSKVGGYIGYTSKAKISGLINTVSIEGDGEFVGGIVGSAESNSEIISCSNEASISGHSPAIGGIVGRASLSPITNCNNSGEIKGLGSRSYNVGGIVGRTSGKLDNCVNTGKVSSVSVYTDVYGGIGGLTGYIWGEVEITNCTNSGSVEAEDLYCVGGLVGSVFSSTIASSNNVDNSGNNVSIKGKSKVGGYIGYYSSEATISGLTNATPVNGKFSYVGGIVGYVDKAATITSCVNTAAITCTYAESRDTVRGFGGIVGFNDARGSLTYCNNSGNITANGAKMASIGGISGATYGIIDHCTNSGDVSTSSVLPLPNITYWWVGIGGITGAINRAAFTNNTNRGSVLAPNMYCVGGLIGLATSITFDNDNILSNDITINGGHYVGCYIGYAASSTIQNIVNTLPMENKAIHYLGGIVGDAHYSHIISCKNKAPISNSLVATGGIAGIVWGERTEDRLKMEVKNCTNEGEIKCTDYSIRTGGIVGETVKADIISCNNIANVSGHTKVGGITGLSEKTATITSCNNSGAIKSASFNAGGIVGINDGTGSITSCQNSGTVTGTGHSAYGIGGIAGVTKGNITLCTNAATATVSSNSTTTSIAFEYGVGGIVGSIFSGSVTKNINNANVLAPDMTCVGGIIGNMSYVTFDNSDSYKNTLGSISITGKSRVGAYIGYSSESTIKNVVNTLSLNLAAECLGGIVGSAHNSTITSCRNEAALTTTKINVGGIVGKTYGSTITSCNNKSAISGYQHVAGIAGFLDGESNVSSCVNTAAITGTSYTIGGIVGYNYGNYEVVNTTTQEVTVIGTGSITNCQNSGNITGSGDDSFTVGGIAGLSSGKINNCTNTGTVSSSSTANRPDEWEYGIGGIAGAIKDSTIINSTNSANVLAPGMTCVGGIVGNMYDATFDGTNSLGNISITGKSCLGAYVGFAKNSTIQNVVNTLALNHNASSLGGIVGYIAGATTVANCTNKANITSEASQVGGIVGHSEDSEINGCTLAASATVIGKGDVGGIVGRIAAGSTSLNSCANMGTVKGKSDHIGGIVGYVIDNDADLSQCRNIGTVSGLGEESYNVGGIVGCMATTTEINTRIINSGNSGSVTTTANNTSNPTSGVGGLVGRVDAQYEAIITNCYNTGSISAANMDNVGGVAGLCTNATFFNCYAGPTSIAAHQTRDENQTFGAFAGKVDSKTILSGSYYRIDCDNNVMQGVGNSAGIRTNFKPFLHNSFSTDICKLEDEDLVAHLNEGAATDPSLSRWISDVDPWSNNGMPILAPDGNYATVAIISDSDVTGSWSESGARPQLATPQINVGDGITAVSYKTSDPSVATVDEDGNVTAVSVGHATITVIPTGDANTYFTHTSYDVTIDYAEPDVHIIHSGALPNWTLSLDGANITSSHFYEYKPVVFDWASSERLAENAWSSYVTDNSSVLTTTTKNNTTIDLTDLEEFDASNYKDFQMRYRVIDGSIDKICVVTTSGNEYNDNSIVSNGNWNICTIELEETGNINGCTVKISDPCATIEIDWIGFFAEEVDNPYYLDRNMTMFGAEFAAGKTTVRLDDEELLPIELISFSAKCTNDGVQVSWATASERNNDYFILERSSDAVNFGEVAKIAGAGNSIETLYYSYGDKGNFNGETYYRLWQVDYDGMRTKSDIIVVTCNDQPTEKPVVNVYPNPFRDDLTVELNNFGDATVNVEVYDMLGRTLATEVVSSPMGHHALTLDMQDFAPATYSVRITSGKTVIVKKVVKQN